MARLSDQLADWLSRVELLARGAEGHRAEAERALVAGRPWEARERALAILDEMPRSRVGLLLWADAAELALLDHEAVEALERLSRELPFRADVWYRLAQARHRLGQPPEEELFRAAELSEPAAAADAARLWLSDLDHDRGDAARAERWLGQLSLGGRRSEAATWRRLELALDAGDAKGARQLAAEVGAPPTLDARAWLTRARALSLLGDSAGFEAWQRAILLDAPGLAGALADHVSRVDSASERARLAELARDAGLGADPTLRAALAVAEGSLTAALDALAEAAESGPPSVADRYLALSLDARDAPRVKHAHELIVRGGRAATREVQALVEALDAPDDATRLEALDRAGSAALAEALRRETYARWLAPPRFDALTAELGRIARALADFESWPDIAGIAADVERPLRVAIVGEFNAGKSSLINALLGEDVAPVGVLPTTATLNQLVWAPDRFARIERRDGGADRVVPHAELKGALGEIPAGEVRRVSIYAPLELLRKLELWDTPGFNAPDSAHALTARAAFRETHVALWLLDATQPLKDSERLVLQEIRDQGLPLVVLANKRDRLAEADVDAALAHIAAGLETAAVTAEAPVVAFSARLALGDAEARRRSRFDEVESLVDRVLVGQSEALKARVLARRCLELATRLAERADERAAARAKADAAVVALRGRVDEALATLDGERALRALEPACQSAVERFVGDTRRVAGILADPGARRFVRARGRSELSRALVHEVLGCLGFDTEREVMQALAPRVETLAATSAVPMLSAALENDADMTVISRELALGLVEEARAALAGLRGALVPGGAEAVQARARTLCDVLRGTH